MPTRCSGFTVTSLERSTGAPYWLVRGTLHGRQIRKEFNRRVDAMAHAEARNAELRGGTADEAPALTHLKPDRVREAENSPSEGLQIFTFSGSLMARKTPFFIMADFALCPSSSGN